MSDSPITRPGEISRIARSDYEFRVFMITSVTEMKSTLLAHQEEDNRRFSGIESRLGMISGSVRSGEKEFSKLDGMKIGILGTAGFFLGVGALVGWLLHYLGTKP